MSCKLIDLSEKFIRAGLIATALAGLSACTFQPLYAPSSSVNGSVSSELAKIYIPEVHTRVAQQVRNHLIFVLNSSNNYNDPTYEARIQVKSIERRTSSQKTLSDTTAGFITVTASYLLVDKRTNKRIADGNKKASAYFDRSAQILANQRAVRDAENRAGREVAEKLRHAFAIDLRK